MTPKSFQMNDIKIVSDEWHQNRFILTFWMTHGRYQPSSSGHPYSTSWKVKASLVSTANDKWWRSNLRLVTPTKRAQDDHHGRRRYFQRSLGSTGYVKMISCDRLRSWARFDMLNSLTDRTSWRRTRFEPCSKRLHYSSTKERFFDHGRYVAGNANCADHRGLPLEWRTWLAFYRCWSHRVTRRVLQTQLNTRFCVSLQQSRNTSKEWYQPWYVDLIIRIKPFNLVFWSITDSW